MSFHASILRGARGLERVGGGHEPSPTAICGWRLLDPRRRLALQRVEHAAEIGLLKIGDDGVVLPGQVAVDLGRERRPGPHHAVWPSVR